MSYGAEKYGSRTNQLDVISPWRLFGHYHFFIDIKLFLIFKGISILFSPESILFSIKKFIQERDTARGRSRFNKHVKHWFKIDFKSSSCCRVQLLNTNNNSTNNKYFCLNR